MLPYRFKAMFRQNLAVLAIAVLPFFSWSQENDSIQKVDFDDFFGSSCKADTITEVFGEVWRLEFYSRESTLCLFKKDKMKWITQIDDVSKFNYSCLLVNYDFKRHQLTGAAVVFAYVENTEEARMVINLRNGQMK